MLDVSALMSAITETVTEGFSAKQAPHFTVDRSPAAVAVL
jgi:hypothetical protein